MTGKRNKSERKVKQTIFCCTFSPLCPRDPLAPFGPLSPRMPGYDKKQYLFTKLSIEFVCQQLQSLTLVSKKVDARAGSVYDFEARLLARSVETWYLII